MNNVIHLPIIGILRSIYKERFAIPRQPNLVNSMAYIEMFSPYDDLNAFSGLKQFSHIWLLWQFHQNKKTTNDIHFQPLIRPPRLGGNKKIGVFASRSMYRPAPVGLSVVQFVDIKRENKLTKVYIRGGDMLDGTPILDIKPYLNYVDSIPNAISGYAQTSPVALQVQWTHQAQLDAQTLLQQGIFDADFLIEIEAILAQNPKPAYQHDPDKIYGLHVGDVNVRFRIIELQQLVEIIGMDIL